MLPLFLAGGANLGEIIGVSWTTAGFQPELASLASLDCQPGSSMPATPPPEPTTTIPATTTPEPTTPESIVTFVAEVQMNASEFNSSKDDYIAGVAVAMNTTESAVEIVSVVEVVTRRRLLDVSVLVETAVTVPADQAESVASSVTADNLNSVLALLGITVAEVTNVTVSAPPEPTNPELATTPTSACPDG